MIGDKRKGLLFVAMHKEGDVWITEDGGYKFYPSSFFFKNNGGIK